jgi:hypothetical protein
MESWKLRTIDSAEQECKVIHTGDPNNPRPQLLIGRIRRQGWSVCGGRTMRNGSCKHEGPYPLIEIFLGEVRVPDNLLYWSFVASMSRPACTDARERQDVLYHSGTSSSICVKGCVEIQTRNRRNDDLRSWLLVGRSPSTKRSLC